MSTFSDERQRPTFGQTQPTFGPLQTSSDTFGRRDTTRGGLGLDAPLLPQRDLTAPVRSDPSATPPQPLEEQKLGRASQILDGVRARRVRWEDAKKALATLSTEDKRTLAKIRPEMSEDEKRALDLPEGKSIFGRIADWGSQSVLEMVGVDTPDAPKAVTNFLNQGLLETAGVDVPGADTAAEVAGNLATGIGRVKTMPAGVVKAGEAVVSDIGGFVEDPLANRSILSWATGGESPIPRTQEEILEPIGEQYKHTYGPALRGDVGTTLSRIKEDPIGPLFDALAVASAGVGTVGRIGAAQRAIQATKVTRDPAGNLRLGVGATKNNAGLLVVRRGKGQNALWYVSKPNGQRVASNFPTEEAAAAHAQSMVTGGVIAPVLEKSFQTFTEHRAEPRVRKGHVRLYRGEGEDYMSLEEQGLLPDESTTSWFTPNRDMATEYDQGGGLWYVDVPEAEAGDYLAAGSGGSYYLPGTIASRAKLMPEPTEVEKTRAVMGEGLKPRTKLQVGAEAFMQRPRGSLIDVYENARGISHSDEIESIVDEVVSNVLDNPNLRLKRRGVPEALRDMVRGMAEDFTSTASKDIGRYRTRVSEQPEFMSPAVSAALSAAGITMREVSDMVRAGAIFLRPAYIPNNWAGNAFLNVIQQGVFAPVNLAKSLVIDKSLGSRYAQGIDQAMGFNASQVMSGGRGAGYVASATDPIAKTMGAIADQPFRRAAWIHEARRSGYKTLGDIQRLWDKAHAERERFAKRTPGEWDTEKTPALAEIGKISRAAQEEIIKFSKYNDIESGILRNLVFVYSWMRGAARYTGRFPMQHPIQAAAMTSLAGVGQNWLNQELGGVPSFLVGAIPVGQDEEGNHVLINPFSINPLGTGMELAAAAGSLKDIVTNPEEFNKYVDQDPSALLNPLIQTGLEAWAGGKPMTESVPETIAALRLKENLEHPGRGQIYPTTRTEALGQYFVGSMFPRESSQAGITRSLQRQRADKPEERIDDAVAKFKKETGQEMPQEFVDLYRQDLQALEKQKDFQDKYAEGHGSQGFSNMPAANRAEAAIEYLAKNKLIAPTDLAALKDTISQVESDYQLNDLANALWRYTGAGRVKDQWDDIMRRVTTGTQLTPARP